MIRSATACMPLLDHFGCWFSLCSGRRSARRGPERLFSAPGRAGGLAELASGRGRARRFAESENPRGGWHRLGRAQSGLGSQCQCRGSNGLSGHPPWSCCRRVVSRRRSHQGVQHLFQLKIIYKHGVWVDPLGFRKRSATGREDSFPRYQGLQREWIPESLPLPDPRRRRSRSGIS